MAKSKEDLKNEIAELVRLYHQTAFAPQPFVPGETAVPYAGLSSMRTTCSG